MQLITVCADPDMISRQSPYPKVNVLTNSGKTMFNMRVYNKHERMAGRPREECAERAGGEEALQVAETITVLAHLEEEKRRRTMNGTLNTIQTIWTKMASPSDIITTRAIHGRPMRKS